MRGNVQIELDELSTTILPLEELTSVLSRSLDAPYLFSNHLERGFRYERPDLRHYCLLRMCRVVSTLNASVGLARLGYTQELRVLLRSANEFCSHIDFSLLGHLDVDEPLTNAQKFVASYFDEEGKADPADVKPFRITQKQIHDAIGASLDAFISKPVEARPTTDLLSNVYGILSGYVHGDYWSTMDLFGGHPGRFHLQGMNGTPKEFENAAMLQSSIRTCSNCFLSVVLGLKLFDLLSSSPTLLAWYNSRSTELIAANSAAQ